mmetsp:Transcript_22144/g.33702  ORF Transcript_22144/g.33702 Transcript_22144/m.33702 type:complete len:119 (-) Transcript_22144:407-763(-)
MQNAEKIRQKYDMMNNVKYSVWNLESKVRRNPNSHEGKKNKISSHHDLTREFITKILLSTAAECTKENKKHDGRNQQQHHDCISDGNMKLGHCTKGNVRAEKTIGGTCSIGNEQSAHG